MYKRQEQLDALLTQYASLVDGGCIATAAVRLATVTPAGATPPPLAPRLAALAHAHAATLAAPRLSAFLAAYAALGAPFTAAARTLLRDAAAAAALAPTAAALPPLAAALSAAAGDDAAAEPEAAKLAAQAAAALLSAPERQPAAAVAAAAELLRLGGPAPADALAALGSAVTERASELTVRELIEVVRTLVAAQSNDTALLAAVAAAFHERRAVRPTPPSPCLRTWLP